MSPRTVRKHLDCKPRTPRFVLRKPTLFASV
jgi:hypothetical protein